MYILATAVLNIAIDILFIFLLLTHVVQNMYVADPTLLVEIKPYNNRDALLVILAVLRLTDLSRNTIYNTFNQFVFTELNFYPFVVLPVGIILLGIFLFMFSTLNVLRRKLYSDRESARNMICTLILTPLIIFGNMNVEVALLLEQLSVMVNL